VSLGAIVLILGVTTVASLIKSSRDRADEPAEMPQERMVAADEDDQPVL
jgi:hypothetical protein